MEKSLRYIFIILSSLPALFMFQALIFYYKARNYYGDLSQGNYLMTMDPSSPEGEYSLLIYRVSSIVLQLIPYGFIFLFICSLLSYFLWRKLLPHRHFYLQTICYLPYLALVILQRVPSGNPVNWFIGYLVN